MGGCPITFSLPLYGVHFSTAWRLYIVAIEVLEPYNAHIVISTLQLGFSLSDIFQAIGTIVTLNSASKQMSALRLEYQIY